MEKLTPFHPKIMNKRRTAGDGMESDESNPENDKRSTKPSVSPTNRKSLLPGRLVQIFPTTIIRAEKKNPQIHSKSPKFVPYEPYAAAVKPMTPQTVSKTKKSRNNMDINTLISQMSQMDTKLSEFKPRPKLSSIGDKTTAESEKSSAEHAEMQKKIDELMKENESLNEQLKQQVQVNKELKTMLVASMGEDLEIQVQSLNEDKKHLANALLSSAQHLSTHQEQTEWLAGQCEVWRSKFLASSLMVEELAHCKRLLNEKTENLQQAIRQLLDERCRARDMLLCTYNNLYSLHEKWLENIAISQYSGNEMFNRPIGNLNFNATMPHSTNILDLSSVNLKLAENISSSVEKQDISHLNSLSTATEGEVHAENFQLFPCHRRVKIKLRPSSAFEIIEELVEGKSSGASKGTGKNAHKSCCGPGVECILLDKTADIQTTLRIVFVMAMPLAVKRGNEEPVNALVHHAYSSSGNTPRPVASCVHCNGKVQLL